MRAPALPLVAAATAAASLTLLSAAAGDPRAGAVPAARADAGPPPVDIRACPRAAAASRRGTATALSARAAALTFVRALLSGRPALAASLADPVYGRTAARRTLRNRPVRRTLRAGPVWPAAHSPDGDGIAAECGGAVLRASWVVGVRVANSPTGPRVVLIQRGAGWRVWAMS